MALFPELVQLPKPLTPIEITRNSKFFLYVENSIGAIDRTHILAQVPSNRVGPFRSRKGQISQNVLAACTFDLFFCYILPGWEGSAHDGRVLQHALSLDFIIPDEKYYLTDAGYASRTGFVVPYRGVRYHLREQAISGLKYVCRSLD